MPKQKHKIIEATVPIHTWLVQRAVYDPALRAQLVKELGRKAFASAKEELGS